MVAILVLIICTFLPNNIDAFKDDSQKNEINERLPKDIMPSHYNIQVMPFLIEGNFTTHGFVSIEIKVKQSTNKIVLHANDLIIDKHSIKVQQLPKNQYLHIVDTDYNDAKQIYTIQLNENMKKGTKYKVDIKYVSHLNDLMQGFYRSKYIDKATNQVRWIASTQFSPTDARRAFPCFDEPNFKATFSISIARPGNMNSLSNMPIKETIKSSEIEGWFWDHYNKTPPMSTYLVALTVNDFQPFVSSTNRRNYTIWARKDVINYTVYGATIIPKLLEYYEDYFNIKFPLPKIDVVAVPDFGFRAMENWGLINFRESVLLLENDFATIEDYKTSSLTISHEISHQWFGNLVTPKWWDDLWLKEGFSTYFKFLGVDYVTPDWNINNEFLTTELEYAFSMDGRLSTKPLYNNVQNNVQIRQAFNRIAYSKGASVIRMMHHFLGEETFRKGLIRYLNDYKFANADHDDLSKSLTEEAHRNGVLESNITVKQIMDTWIIQSGYPVITAVAESKDTVRLVQKRFLISGEEPKYEQTWWVPISYATKSNPNFKDTKVKNWMRNKTETVINLDTSNWWILNLQHTDYFIVNYDDNNWNKLEENILNFPSSTKAQLISNSMDLARANLLNYNIPLKMILSIGQNTKEYIPYSVVFNKLEYLHNMLRTTSAFTNLNKFILTSFKTAFNSINFDDNSKDSYQTQNLRRLVLEWSCKQANSNCLIESVQLYKDWMLLNKTISPNLRNVVYCTAIQEGGEIEWNFAYNKYLNTTQSSEKITLLKALGCTTKPWILFRYLFYTINSKSGIKKQDGYLVFESVAKNFVGHGLAFEFLFDNWKQINNYYGMGFNLVAKMVDSLSSFMNTQNHIEQLELFRDENNLYASKQAFNNLIEDVRGNVRWMDNCYIPLKKWLQEQKM